MSSLRARLALSAYRFGGIAVYPFIGPYLAVRAAKGKEDSSAGWSARVMRAPTVRRGR